MFRKENGVTLVALVITIIVLLILAGVTISMVMGDDSIINNAKTAADNTDKQTAFDAVSMACLNLSTKALGEKYANGNSSVTTTVNAAAIASEASDILGEDGKATVSGSDIKVTLNNVDWYVPIEINTDTNVATVTAQAATK